MSRADEANALADKAMKGKLLYEVTLSNDKVKFSFNQAKIPKDAAALLDDLIAKVKSYNKAVYVEIEGHTDNTGSPAYNLQLGEQRAMAVRNYLYEGGIPLHAINVVSRGEEAPVADNKTSDGRAQNRRVVVKVLE
jgi:peptidoglycan-associated lipoprotein